MRFSRQEYWSELPCPPLGDLPDPEIEPMSLVSPALASGFFTISATWAALRNPNSMMYIFGNQRKRAKLWSNYTNVRCPPCPPSFSQSHQSQLKLHWQWLVMRVLYSSIAKIRADTRFWISYMVHLLLFLLGLNTIHVQLKRLARGQLELGYLSSVTWW